MGPHTEKPLRLYDQTDELNCRDCDEVLTKVYTLQDFPDVLPGQFFLCIFCGK